jgi:cell division protease FtsH
MSEKVGNISFYDATGQRDAFTKPFSERTAELIDEEVRRIVDEAVELTRQIISQERENIERLADLLLEKETIFAEDVEGVLGKSAQEVAKAEAEHSSQAENIEDSTEIKYIIEPSEEESNEKME